MLPISTVLWCPQESRLRRTWPCKPRSWIWSIVRSSQDRHFIISPLDSTLATALRTRESDLLSDVSRYQPKLAHHPSIRSFQKTGISRKKHLCKPPHLQLGWGAKRSPKQFTECYARSHPFRSVETEPMLRAELLSRALDFRLMPCCSCFGSGLLTDQSVFLRALKARLAPCFGIC